MSKTPVSKSQTRAMRLMILAPVEGYKEAAEALEAANCYPDGIPANMTWRQAAKLSDSELIAGLKRVYDDEPNHVEYE